jgi:hypothetical protein
MMWANSSAAATPRSKHDAHLDSLHVENRHMQRLDCGAKYGNKVPCRGHLATGQRIPVTPAWMKSP